MAGMARADTVLVYVHICAYLQPAVSCLALVVDSSGAVAVAALPAALLPQPCLAATRLRIAALLR